MSIQAQLSTLIGLANIDKDVADVEKDMIYMIGKANGLSQEDIDDLFINTVDIPPLSTITGDEKFDYLFNLVQLMKIDKEVYLVEIKYCEEIAVKLGFQKAVIAELSSKIYSDPSITTDIDLLKKTVLKFQN